MEERITERVVVYMGSGVKSHIGSVTYRVETVNGKPARRIVQRSVWCDYNPSHTVTTKWEIPTEQNITCKVCRKALTPAT